ncbi:FtsK/SpoIIIE family DNA translocase [Deinococcus cellulosilyticus]|uniref:FtsK/SpoIIIE family DNA translocase n=1 Tax=Deinococcus cellulosilyticus TaxID=401558 RepID=UPI001FE301C7|nr:DNA translocase FtsK [Deinococcus cellulosilyticus]
MTKRIKSASKSKKVPVQPGNHEVYGLVLFAVALFCMLCIYAPSQYTGGLGTSVRDYLKDNLGWAAYAIPLYPIVYGVLSFMEKSPKTISRQVIASLILLVSGLLASNIIEPLSGGQWLGYITEPIRQSISWGGLLLPLVGVTLGAEVLLLLPPFSLLIAFFRLISERVVGLAQTTELNSQQRKLYGKLRVHEQELEALMSLYPSAQELKVWLTTLRKAKVNIPDFTPEEKLQLEEELNNTQELLQEFSTKKAREITEHLQEEEYPLPELPHELERPLKLELQSAQLMEGHRVMLTREYNELLGTIRKMNRERDMNIKTLSGNVRAVQLRQVLSQQESRTLSWKQTSKAVTAWQQQVDIFVPWMEFLVEVAAHAQGLVLDSELAKKLTQNFKKTLREIGWWEKSLENLQGSPAVPASKNEVAENVEFDLDFSSLEFSFEDPTPISADPVPAPTYTPPAPASREEEETPPWMEAEEPEDDPAEASNPLEPQQPKANLKDPQPTVGAIPATKPTPDLLDPIPNTTQDRRILDQMARERADLISQTLSEFKVQARVVDHARGPTVTRYEIEPAPGEKISRISGLSNDLARALAVGGVRVEAPVPGKSVIGLEVPNAEREPITFHAAIASKAFGDSKAKLPIVLGKSIDGEMYVGDLARMPHLLIAGSTGSGKSVCVNTLIVSLLYRYLPQELRFVMIDPKMVELTPYDGIPHLIRPVVTNPADAAGVLLGTVAHMERRYKMMSQVGAKNLEQYNAKMRQIGEPELPFMVIIIDELADLMITSPKEVESAIMRLAQMARATGMHLVLATQRPSVDILTSLIKVNVPARIAFAVSSSHDSRTILDNTGAERLTGQGDMLFYQPGLVKPVRLQGPYISEGETVRINDYLRRQFFEDWFGEAYGTDFDGVDEGGAGPKANGPMDFSDPLLRQAAEICIEEGQGSVSRLQRRLSVGHARAGKLMDMLEAMGIVSKHQGSKPRDILITREDLPEFFGK